MNEEKDKNLKLKVWEEFCNSLKKSGSIILNEKDIDEFLWRARCYELVTGAFLSTSCSHKDIKKCEGHTDEKTGVKANGKGNIPVPFTREMIAPYAGLSTNVIRLSRAKWLTKMKKRIAEDATSSLRRSESLD